MYCLRYFCCEKKLDYTSVECRVSSVECRVSSVECRVSSVECRVSSNCIAGYGRVKYLLQINGASALSLHKKQSSTYKKYACGCFLCASSICIVYLQKADGKFICRSCNLIILRHLLYLSAVLTILYGKAAFG